MKHTDINSSPSSTEYPQYQLILVDDQLIKQAYDNVPDLYLQLVKEPSFIKKQSVKYDYNPSPFPFIEESHKISLKEQLENFSQIDGIISKTTKCTCCKTKCQKNYCQCFKAGVACGTECSCTDCCNDEISMKSLPKRNSGTGCKCQKSHCMKKYCQCHSGGKKCTEECRCLDCHNVETKEVKQNTQEVQLLVLSKPNKKIKRQNKTQQISESIKLSPFKNFF